MSIETNKAQMELFVKFVNTNDPALAEMLVAPDAAFHVPFQEEPLVGPTAYEAVVNMMRGGFSDIQWELLEMVAEGDTVAARFQTHCTHDGTFFGFAATGRKIVGRAMMVRSSAKSVCRTCWGCCSKSMLFRNSMRGLARTDIRLLKDSVAEVSLRVHSFL